MSTIDVNLPGISAEQALSIFPEFDSFTDATLDIASSEGVIELFHEASDWADIIQIQADSLDQVDTAADDVKYKVNGSWPNYYAYDSNGVAAETTLALAPFSGDAAAAGVAPGGAHRTIGGTASGASDVRFALKVDQTEDILGQVVGFDIFANEEDLFADYAQQSSTLENTVSTNWEAFVGVEKTNADDTALGQNPAKTIVTAVLALDSTARTNTLAENLATAAGNSFASLPLTSGDVLRFNVTYQAAPTQGGENEAFKLRTSASGFQNHQFQVKVTLVDTVVP